METSARPSVEAYLRTWGLELKAKQNRVRQLIGDAHWLTDGHHKESILRDFLSRYLPAECECSTGFVRGSGTTGRCSPEVDIMLYSRRLHIPYFCEGGVSVIDPSSLLANLEIKSSFSSTSLKSALDNVKETRSQKIGVHSHPSDLWSGIFFYDLPANRTLDSTIDTVGAEIKTRYADGSPEAWLPTCIVLGQDRLAFPSIERGSVKIRAFECHGLSFASGICDLLAFITPLVGGVAVSGFEEWGASGEFQKLEKLY